MRIAVCDDNKSEQEEFIEILQEWDSTREPEPFIDGASLLSAAWQSPPFDIVFLDIYMPGENGVEIARELHNVSPQTGIVFVTTSREHAVDAFSLYALHYLVKPVTTEGIVESFRRLAKLHSVERPMITLTIGRTSHTVYLDEICYLQSDSHALGIVLTNGRYMKIWTPLREMIKKLDGRFLKINRGTVVNMDYIEQMGIDTCILQDGTKLVLTRRERSSIRSAYDDYMFSRLSLQKDYVTEVKP